LLNPEHFDAICSKAVEIQRLPGLSVAVAKGGECVFKRGYGYRNVGDRLPANADTIYSIASVTKQFTAAAILRLQERGLLSIDEPVTRYFPWLPGVADVNLFHLLAHTSGIPGYTEAPDFERLCFSDAELQEVVMTGASRPLAFAPGTAWQYSNTNYVLLGAIIERVSGRSYEEFLSESFFDPLGMASTGVDDVSTVRPNYAVGHTSYSLGPLERAREWNPCWEFATGNLFSTVVDLARWNQGLRSGAVVSEASYAAMSRPHILPDGRSTKYGFGLFIDQVDGIVEIRHTGGLPGFSSDNAFYPSQNLDIVVIANRDAAGTYFAATQKILAIAADRDDISTAYRVELDPSVSTPPDPSTWIDAARGDILNALPLTRHFHRFLTPQRLSSLRKLAEYGDVKAFELLQSSRRDPVNVYSYKVDFEKGTLSALAITTNDNKYDMIAFYPSSLGARP
jgi:D-alanyl-D-alanine carboxypeptidase